MLTHKLVYYHYNAHGHYVLLTEYSVATKLPCGTNGTVYHLPEGVGDGHFFWHDLAIMGYSIVYKWIPIFEMQNGSCISRPT